VRLFDHNQHVLVMFSRFCHFSRILMLFSRTIGVLAVGYCTLHALAALVGGSRMHLGAVLALGARAATAP
jgi:hypothetical protein